MKSQCLVKLTGLAPGVGQPRDGVGPGDEAADDREPGEGAQDGHFLGSHLRCRLHAAAQRAHCLGAGKFELTKPTEFILDTILDLLVLVFFCIFL